MILLSLCTAWASPELVRTQVVVAQFDTQLALEQATDLLARPDLESVAIEAMKLDQRVEVCVATEVTYAMGDRVDVGRLSIWGPPDDVWLQGVVPCGPGVAVNGSFPASTLQSDGLVLMSTRSSYTREPVAGRGQQRQLARELQFADLSWGWTRRERRQAVSTLWASLQR